MRRPAIAHLASWCAPIQEFQPWLKWLLYDALFTLVLRAVAGKSDRLRTWFELVGWV
jgi:hypothetical protein